MKMEDKVEMFLAGIIAALLITAYAIHMLLR